MATVALDPWRGYVSALVVPLGHVRVVVDHVHTIRLANTVVDQVRRRTQQATLGHRGRKRDRLYRIRKLLLTAQEQLTQRDRCGCGLGWRREILVVRLLRPGRARSYSEPSTERSARAALDRFYRWCDGVQVSELSRLARTVRAWEAEI